MTVIASTTTEQAHRLRLVHAATGAALAARPAGLDLPWGWSMRTAGADVILTRRAGSPDLPIPAGEPAAHLDLVIIDGVVGDRLALPPLAPGQAAASVRVALTAPVIETAVDPLPGTVTVVLAKVGTGAPSTGRAVKLRPSAGADVTLTETPAGSGVYTAGPQVWGAAFNPADLRIGTTNVRKVSPDYTRAETRIHAVDPT